MHTDISMHSFSRRGAQQKTDLVLCITWVLGPTDDLHVLLPLQQCSQGLLVFIHKLVSILPNVVFGRIDVAIHFLKASLDFHLWRGCMALSCGVWFCMSLHTISLMDTHLPTWVFWLMSNYSVFKCIILFSQICNIGSEIAQFGDFFRHACSAASCTSVHGRVHE